MRKRLFEYRLARTKQSICMDELGAFAITEPEQVANIMRKLVKDSPREHMFAFYLTCGNQILGYELLGIGASNWVSVSIPELLRSALVSGGVAVILSHNHPSGNTKPSDADNDVTREAKKGLDAVGLQLVDHLIVTNESHYSYASSGVV